MPSQDELDKCYSRLLRQPEGRRVFFDLLETAGVFRSVFDKNASVMCMREGWRNSGLRLQAKLLEVNSDHYMLMLQEGLKRADRTDQRDDGSHLDRFLDDIGREDNT